MRFRLVPDTTNIDFFRYMRFWLAVSIIGVIGSFVSLAIFGLNYGVDFRGGTLIMAATPEAHEVGEFRTLLTGLDVGEVGVTTASDATGAGRHVVLMRLGVTGEDATNQRAAIATVQGALDKAFPGITYLQVDSVGAKVSEELVRDGVIAVLLSVVGIMIYVWLRFEWQFGLGAAASLLHDAIVVVGLFSVFQLEFNLTIVAAVLTVLGYSINDTVVVFDRVREVLRKYKKMPLRDVLNLALNETLSRTVMTVLTTLLALIAILLFGGQTVRGFAIAVIFGILIGTYSSIYVASAVVLRLGVRRDWGAQKAEADAKRDARA
ncbi:protein translocase subunit SecF [Amaricoccus solimangrovi]|uniref:Protein-export membrane protein SecF n=1 Tax=Amaricoccus solimangrovi TaxID=2589815 RepID=A0A501X0X6_9RHOB|nr:protein translocase subunit SecF [Amaricoccus solimangrovi]TPE53751.1 protein translocase subunit SecF [Amaricoccus solimangrovi]